jgi:hypothetical protein
MVLATVRPRTSGGCDGDWRRYMALLLDGMRPAPVPLPARAAVSAPAATLPDERHSRRNLSDESAARR